MRFQNLASFRDHSLVLPWGGSGKLKIHFFKFSEGLQNLAYFAGQSSFLPWGGSGGYQLMFVRIAIFSKLCSACGGSAGFEICSEIGVPQIFGAERSRFVLFRALATILGRVFLAAAKKSVMQPK